MTEPTRRQSTAPESKAAEPAWQNPWFMAAFFCAALAAGLLWQSAQIDAESQQMIDQLRASVPASG